MSLKVEKIKSPVYPAYLHVGDYSIALDPELIQSLKEIAQEETTRFFEILVQKVGSNQYLKEMIQEEISKAEDPATLAKQLQEEIRML